MLESLEELPGAAGAFECVAAAIDERESRAGDQVFHSLGDENLGWFGQSRDSRTDADGDPADLPCRRGDLTRVDARSHLKVERSQGFDDRLRALHPPCGTVEGREEAVSGGVLLDTAVAREHGAYGGVVPLP